ncbi:hypothetical protein GLYMA_13G151500v4 [Glycine max]|uniref:putative phytosulfokines 6 isoform X2 n=1 Tax=Glycine max TaxID=3847 RepID=UPI001B356820|nr:putative phytosulfokines 6 isoform X2 [Glycine max]KAG4383747.1 hypothetical protein GLYMA_13G151500v4 [Glycine max]KAH1101630.1 hypothetical protein GYH30_036273 [Glycine max]
MHEGASNLWTIPRDSNTPLASSRLLEPLKGEKEVEVNENAIPQSSDMEELIGSEECYMKDEECTSRRMMVEAHLDYIYTQHHKH